MHRQPPHLHHRGGGGVGGRGAPPPPQPQPQPQPQFPPSNFLQNPNFLPLQNPNLLNPFLQNPNLVNFPIQNPNLVNFPIQNPNLVNFPIRNPNLVNFQFPFHQQQLHQNQSSRPHNEAVQRADGAVAKARRELLAAGESVSAWKVSQAALMALKVNSWESLGFPMQQVPSLHSLIVIEEKVNAFIHCFVAVRRICSLYDIELELCKNEGVERFEELELGPLVRHPLVVLYFSLSSDATETFRITSEEIINHLHEFMDSLRGGEVNADEFLDYVAKKRSVTGKEKLNVRIQNLGRHITHLRQARKSENTVLNKYLKELKKDSGRKIKIRPLLSSQKKQMDDHFGVLTDRIKSFSSTNAAFSGNHIRFVSSSSEDEDDDDEEDDSDDDDPEDNQDENQVVNHFKVSSQNVKSSDRLSSCPYPSAIEEMTRLGLKSEANGSTYVTSGSIRDSSNSEASKRKRKFENINRAVSSPHNLVHQDEEEKGLSVGSDCLKKRARNADGPRESMKSEEQPKKGKKKKILSGDLVAKDLSVADDTMRLFITTWKEACQEHDIDEVFDRMLEFYKFKKKKKVKEFFSSYPFVGLLNVAVTSIKRGMWDSIYDSLLTFSQQETTLSENREACISIEVEQGGHRLPVSTDKTSSYKCGITIDDIIEKITAYLEANIDTISSPEEKRINFLRRLCKCESWLIKELAVEEFKSLGFGEFLTFLDRHMHLLSSVLHKCLMGDTGEKFSLEACMQQLQLDVLISQASNSLWENESISKQKIFELLRRQFPLICFKIVENDSTVENQHTISQGRTAYNCVLFSATLLKKPYAGGLAAQNENSTSENFEVGHKTGVFDTPTAKEAIEVLLGAPMLTDLELWSHWDLVFAPTLGPLVEWLLDEVNAKELLCLVTRGGKVIRIDHSATMDSFLEVLLRGSSFETAVQLLSLFTVYGGEQNVPKSLLKCHIQKAFEVSIKNSIEIEMNDDHNCLMEGTPLFRQHVFNEGAATNLTTELCRNGSPVNKVVPVVARFILDCLSYLPLEFCRFTADVFLAALKSFVRDAPSAILVECKQIEQRLILHEVGISLGVVEWINDYKNFCSLENANSLISSKSSNLITSSFELNTGSKFVCGASDKQPSESKTVVSMEADQDKNCKASDKIGVPEVSNQTYADNSGCHSFVLDKCSDPVGVIETIRREEFGLDPTLSDTESGMLKKQHARLGRALHCLSQELYSQDSHFLLELVQNADDNVYPEDVEPTLTFILQEKGIIILNNEQGFSAENIRALCDVGNSTKKGHSAGYIGKKGIGFKSVFRITNAPEIHSNGFHIKFDISEGQIGFVLPTVIPPCDVDWYSRLVSRNTYQVDQNRWNTCIVLPFSPNLSGGIAMNNIISMFSDLHPSLLLFLHRLKCITFRNMLSDTFVVMKKEAGADGLVKVFLGDERMNWLVVSQKLLPNVIRPDVQTTEISIAFTLQEVDEGEYVPQLNQQPVFAFLPLRTYGLKFIIQGDFDLPSSREGVDGDSPWNQWLLSEFPGLFVSSERSFFNLPCFRKCPGKAVGSFMSFVPLVGEVHGFFSSLPRMIISKLRMSNCLLLDGDKNEWVPPCKVIRNWTEQARALIPDSLLSEHLGLGFLNKDIVLSDSLAKALGVEEYGPKILLQIIRSLCHSENGLKSMGLGWLSAWLSAFYVMTLNTGIESDIVNSLRKLPFVPLSDGKHGSLDEGIIWLHSDALSFNNEYGSEAFPKLYSQLRTVSPALFSAAATVDISFFDTSITENVTRMLLRVGIQQLSAHDIMKAHILPAISDDRSKPGDEDLMTEYLAFSMFHLNSSCPNCGLEKESIIAELRRKVFISTNHGHKRPVEVPIHFSKEFGNPININKLTNGMDMIWHEVNVTYLNHPLIKSVAGGVLKWRTFLQELGVTDFVQVVQVEKNIADVPQDVLKYLTWDQGLISIDSIAKDWESEELVYLLSQLSSRGDKEKCKYLLEILDMLWDDIFGNKVTGSCNITPTGESKLFKSSLISMFNEFQWMVSSMDDELHYPKDLFYDCIAVHSILGDIAPYAVPKVKSEKLLKDIGLKTEVALDDMLSVLKVWRKSETTFKASISQMSKFYNLIWSEMATSKEKVMEELQSGPFIFVPYAYGSSRGNVVPGAFLSPEEVYWHDSTGSMDYMKVIVTESAQDTTHHTSNKTLCHVYPTLHDFFVNECGVHEIPPCRSYLQVLLQLSAVALPSQAAKTVFQIFLRWADGLKSGSLASEDVEVLKENLTKKEYPVLPTAQDKWVSLNSSYGLVCWSDDENLRKEFKHQDNIDFLYFGELNNEEKEVLNTKFPVLMQRLGIRALSQVVTREAIYYGPADSTFKASLVNWALPYAQRYIYSVHPREYSQLKQSGFETLKKLQIIVVEKLFYKNVIKKSEVASKKRYECNSLLQGNILYTTRESDSHTVFLELSHLFFDEPELHLANFLHMITTMVESGSSEEQAEFFILNSQKVPKIPDGEVVWSLSSLSLARANDEILVTNRVPPGTNEAEHLKPKRRPDMNSNWPPANWRTAPGFCFTRENGFKTQAANNQQIGNGDDVEENRTQTDSCNPIQIRVEGTLESDQVTSAPFVIVEDSKTTEIRSQFGTSEATSHMNVTFDSVDPVAAPDGSRSVLANFSEREQLSFGTPNMQQARLTGRMGEYVAYQYFVSRITDTFVRWVNEATETGLPYDLIVGDDERSLEYIEVKATKSARKDWFIISAREWQFAVEKGESFSIAYVVLSGDNMARVTVYKNPVKLCQLGKLQLAVVIPKQQ